MSSCGSKRKAQLSHPGRPCGPPLTKKPSKKKPYRPKSEEPRRSEEQNPWIEDNRPPLKKKKVVDYSMSLSKPGQSEFADYLWGRSKKSKSRSGKD